MQTSALDLVIIAVYLIGITLFGCSFYFRKGGRDARTFTTGGGHIPGWAIALSIFATQVSSISFLALPAKAYLSNWNCFVLTLTIPIAAFVAAKWFVPFYRRSASVSAYSFLEERFGPWARIYASACFLIMQTARSGVILFLLALTLKSALGFSCFWIIVVTGIVTMLYSMLGGFKAVIWADAIQSLILLLGTLAVIVSLCFNIPGGLGNGFRMAWDAGKFSLGSFSLKEWGIETFWVSFLYGLCINLQNYGIDQSFTQRYVAAKDERSAVKSAFSGAMMYIPGTLLFVLVGTLLWMFSATHPGLIPTEVVAQSDAVFPWYIVHRLPHGISGLLVAAIIAAAMSTVAATLNSGSTVLLEDYYKRFFPSKASVAGRNIRFLRSMTVLLTAASICVAVAVMNVESALTAWWGMQSVLSGGMLGLFLLGAFSKRTTSSQAAIATVLGLLVVVFITFGQRLPGLSPFIHVNLSIALGTLTLFLTGTLLAALRKR
ncbi:MAG: sodium/solute symporter [Bacteroidales bacterium]|nr:sodium/solute symporter [Bacteroidales bacterium]